MRIRLIACEVICREACWCASRSSATVIPDFLLRGYHSNPETLRHILQERIDQVDPEQYRAVALGYGLCSNGIAGLQARSLPLVIPVAHDCITFFLGSKERYLEHFTRHPGTYWYTAGWVEHAGSTVPRLVEHGAGLDLEYDELVNRYGEDNARYLWEFSRSWIRNYTHAAFVRMGLPHEERFRAEAEQAARDNGWQFYQLEGSLGLIERLLAGDWESDDFLVVPPGAAVAATGDERILAANCAGGGSRPTGCG